jgi:hypothetical protein
MTLFQIEELTSYWAQHPPAHLLIAAYLGIAKTKPQGYRRRRWNGDSDRVRIPALCSLTWGLGLVPETSMPGSRP